MVEPQYRAVFDFEIEFTNGGGLRGHDFRLDIEGDDIGDAELVDHVVSDLRLLMVGPARILNKRIVIATHKRRQPETGRAGRRRHVDLSHVLEDGLVTYPGLPAAQVCDYLSRRSDAHTSELQSLMSTSYAGFCLKKKTTNTATKH